MSTWRRKAIECLPRCKREFEARDANIYDVFIEMRYDLRRAHVENDVAQLKKCYDFAEWCMRQKTQYIRNAAGVAFYEHLADEPETMEAMSRWVSKDIYLEIRSLLAFRIGDGPVSARLDEAFGNTTKSKSKTR